MDNSITLITPTWRGDLTHFKLLRASLERSGLSNVLHKVVVQSEDLEAFQPFANSRLELTSTGEVLPVNLEMLRKGALAKEFRRGRHLTRLSGSLARVSGFPCWPRYTGWHTQQICKLKVASEVDSEYAAVIDSDVVVCPGATASSLVPPRDFAIHCYGTWESRNALSSKVSNWLAQSEKLIGASPEMNSLVNNYFDTPFIFHVPSLKDLFKYLEERYEKVWWNVLLDQPPRRWSEFATYKAFLALKERNGASVTWDTTDHIEYIFDASDSLTLIQKIKDSFASSTVKFITVHSQSKGRQLWSAEAWADDLLEVLNGID